MNVKLLRKIRKHILEEPARFMMDDFCARGKPGKKTIADNAERTFPKCGTVACIAGWACLLSDVKIGRGFDFSNEAARLLEIEPEIEDDGRVDFKTSIAARLFYVHNWPHRFEARYEDAESAKERAQIAAERIDRFIVTDGGE